MKVTIIIKCDNAAFEGNVNGELASILGNADRKLAAMAELKPGDRFVLPDSNGNIVGTLEVTE